MRPRPRSRKENDPCANESVSHRMAPLSQQLQSLGADLDRALDDLPAALYVLDRGGKFVWLNGTAVEIFGEMRGRHFAGVVAPDQVHLARKQFARKLIGEVLSTDYDLALIGRSGERIRTRISSVALRDNGSVTGVLALALPERNGARERTAAEARRATAHPTPPLTARQYEVLNLLGEGLPTPEIAARLGVSDETARNHIRALLRQLDARSRLQAVVKGYRLGLLEPSD
jgi:PAS domain S-box-containing protein